MHWSEEPTSRTPAAKGPTHSCTARVIYRSREGRWQTKYGRLPCVQLPAGARCLPSTRRWPSSATTRPKPVRRACPSAVGPTDDNRLRLATGDPCGTDRSLTFADPLAQQRRLDVLNYAHMRLDPQSKATFPKLLARTYASNKSENRYDAVGPRKKLASAFAPNSKTTCQQNGYCR